MGEERIELEEASEPLELRPDRRPTIPPPLPVRLVAIDDVRLPAVAEVLEAVRAFYVELLGFAAESSERFRADNFRLCFEVRGKPLERDTARATVIEVRSLIEVRQRLSERKIAYETVRGLTGHLDVVILRDPAGNWLALVEVRDVR